MIYFEDAQLEIFGAPLAYLRSSSRPIRRSSARPGCWSRPSTSSTSTATASRSPTSGRWHRTMTSPSRRRSPRDKALCCRANGASGWSTAPTCIRASGIFQLDKERFQPNGCRRPATAIGAAASKRPGQFSLTHKWTWGWDGTLFSDQTYLQDYGLNKSTVQIVQPPAVDAGLWRCHSSISWDAATAAISICAPCTSSASRSADDQRQLPIIHPVMDYDYIFQNPVFGGELSLPQQSDQPVARHRELRPDLAGGSDRQPLRARRPPTPQYKNTTNCLLRGVPGTYTGFRPKRPGSTRSSIPTVRSSSPSSACAATWPT